MTARSLVGMCWAACCASLLAACSADAPAIATLSCTPGDSAVCACPGGITALQMCLATQVYEPCPCPGGLAGSSGGAAGTTAGTGAAGVDAAGSGGTGSAGDAAGSGATAGSGGAGGSGGQGGAEPSMLPTASQACPTITEGDVMFLGRKVRIWVGSPDLSKPGPLVFYWHGTGSSPIEAQLGLGAAIADIKSQGGMVAAMDSEGGSGMSTGNDVWFYEDFDVADEILACAIEQIGIDVRRIHASGMSAGGLQTTAMSYARSGYVASVAPYSGGVITFNGIVVTSTTSQDPSNKLAAMIVHGGAGDSVGIDFDVAGEAYRANLESKGQFAFLCNHNMGHTIPSGISAHVWRFFQDHPFNVTPEPYASALPATFPAYCEL